MSAENINGTSTLPFLSSPNEDAYPPPLDLEATDYSEVANEDNILLDEIPIYDELEFFGLNVEIMPPNRLTMRFNTSMKVTFDISLKGAGGNKFQTVMIGLIALYPEYLNQ